MADAMHVPSELSLKINLDWLEVLEVFFGLVVTPEAAPLCPLELWFCFVFLLAVRYACSKAFSSLHSFPLKFKNRNALSR